MNVLRMAMLLLAFGFAATRGPAQEMRAMRYARGTEAAALAWQGRVRARLSALLGVEDLMRGGAGIPLEPTAVDRGIEDGVRFEEVQVNSTAGRRISIVVARGAQESPGIKIPAVVCIHGHGGNRFTPFNPDAAAYKRFGLALAQAGYAVLSTDVGQHTVQEPGRTLMGERLWDLMRCVDYGAGLGWIDARRIACAGLSLGGEMAMWLGALDTRIAAVVSCGFLTVMDQMEQNHCLCWKVEGLRGLVDFPDIYALIAPRRLQCQNGWQEPETQFNVPLAQKAMEQTALIYADMKRPENVELLTHPGGHEIALEPLLAFLKGSFSASQ